MLFSNAQSKSMVVSSCRVSYNFHHSLPCWFTKSLHIVVSIQPAGEHFWQTIFGFPGVVFINCFQTSRLNSETSTNGLPCTCNWHHLCQYIKVIILSYTGSDTGHNKKKKPKWIYVYACIVTHTLSYYLHMLVLNMTFPTNNNYY